MSDGRCNTDPQRVYSFDHAPDADADDALRSAGDRPEDPPRTLHSPSAELAALSDLIDSHRDHDAYFAIAPESDAEAVLRAARTLKVLAERRRQARWRPASPSSRVLPGRAADHDRAAEEARELVALEAEAERAELAAVLSALTARAAAAERVGASLDTSMETRWRATAALLPEVGDLSAARHPLILSSWQAAHLSRWAGVLLARAVAVLATVDRAAIDRRGADSLSTAAALLDRAAAMWLTATTFSGAVEGGWQGWLARLETVLHAYPDLHRPSAPPPGG